MKRKRAVTLAVLLGALCGSTATAGVMAMSDDHAVSVESHTPEPRTRDDYIRDWKTALAKSGTSLPPKAKIAEMSTQEIFEAWSSERRKHAEPMDMPNEIVE